MALSVIILAAGKGTRMRSKLPKVLHQVGGKTLLGRVIDTARSLVPQKIVVVYGHGGDTVKSHFAGDDLHWVEQADQRGTGHAVQLGLAEIADDHHCLILYGDVPLIEAETLVELSSRAGDDGLAVLTTCLEDATGYGRIVRDTLDRVLRIVEHKDASKEELTIGEINSGILLANAGLLRQWTSKLTPGNAQGELYLTDVIEMAVADHVPVAGVITPSPLTVAGINDRAQLAELERYFQGLQATELMRQGVTLRDPARFDLRGSLKCGFDVVIEPNVIIEGDVVLGDNVHIGANSSLRDSIIAADTIIKQNCVIDNAKVGESCIVGPYARLRPGTDLIGQNHVGNFVEIKKSRVELKTKINHLSYIGDAVLGEEINIGAGTITCNYDGANKHITKIGAGVFVGSNTALVAPIEIGDGATIAAGSTLTKDVPAAQLAIARSRQVGLDGYKRPAKKKD